MKTHSSRSVRRRPIARRILEFATAGIMALVLVACSTAGGGGGEAPNGGGEAPGSGKGGTATRKEGFYTGPIPQPADLMAWQGASLDEVPEMPEMPDPDDPDFEKKMEEFEKWLAEATAAHTQYGKDAMGPEAAAFGQRIIDLVEETRAGGEAAVAAWQSLLVASGVAVSAGGGRVVEVNGMSGGGIPMTQGELRVHTLVSTSSGYLSLTAFADMLVELGFDASVRDGRTLVDDLYDDLVKVSSDDYALGQVMYALNPTMLTSFRFERPRLVPAKDVTLTGAQTSLLLRRIAAQVAHKADQQGIPVDKPIEKIQAASAGGGGAIRPAAKGAGEGAACGPHDSLLAETIHKGTNTLGGKAFSKLLSRFAIKAGTVHGFLGAAVGSAGLMANFFQLEAEPSMANAPLVRTKNREPGEQRELRLRFSIPKQSQEYVNCMQQIFAVLGFDLGKKEGPMAGIDIEVNRLGERVQFARSGPSGTAKYRQKTDKSGVAVFPIEGKAQQGNLPAGAEPEEATSSARYSANLEGSDLMKSLRDAVVDAAGGVPNMIVGALSRMNLAVFDWEIPVRDWGLDAEFEMTLSGTLRAHYGHHVWTRGLYGCRDSTINNSVTSSSKITSQPHRVTVRHLTVEDEAGGPIGGTLIHTKGVNLRDIPEHLTNGGELAFLDVSYKTERRADSPGIAPMPKQHFDHQGAGCGDGKPMPTPAPDCGTRDFRGVVTVNVLDGRLHLTADEPPTGKAWQHCGQSVSFHRVLTPPQSVTDCKNPSITGGELPSLEAIFNEGKKFTVTGTMNCTREAAGILDKFSFDWTLEFCRIENGARAC